MTLELCVLLHQYCFSLFEYLRKQVLVYVLHGYSLDAYSPGINAQSLDSCGLRIVVFGRHTSNNYLHQRERQALQGENELAFCVSSRCPTYSLMGAKTGGEADCWSVPLEVFVMHGTPLSKPYLSVQIESIAMKFLNALGILGGGCPRLLDSARSGIYFEDSSPIWAASISETPSI